MAIPFRARIVKATILGFGTINWELLNQGGPWTDDAGLVIDFMPKGDDIPRRVALGFTELGMWVAYQGEIEDSRNCSSMPGADQ